ncbi:Cytochrome P450 family protein [Rutstroemia sp. NJR-2017a BVV2]|nr:Cytochrome P450 family protein [Rutstroemia sp. NJR-2017a BVV2]
MDLKRMEAVKAGRQMGLFMEHFNNIGKTWEENFFGARVFNTMDVQNIQQVSALAFDDYGKPAQNFFKPFLGDGFLSLDGLAWKHSRDLVKPIFSRSEVSDVDTLGFHVDRFLELIPSDGKTIDIQEPLHNLFLDLATEFLFGQSIEAQLPEDPNHSKDFLRAFNGALAGVGKRRLAGKLHPLIYAFDKTWKRDIDQVYSYIDRHIHRALEAEAAGQEEKADPNPSRTTRRYVLLNELVKHIKDPIKLRYQVLNGPAGRVQRLALRDTVLPHGGGHDGKSAVLVRKGDVVALNLWGPNHDRDVWGDDVGEFKPQRFIGRKMGWEFTPFLGGPRICPAQQQVLTQAVYLRVRLARKFSKIENRDPVLEYVEMVRMTTESRNGVKIGLFA